MIHGVDGLGIAALCDEDPELDTLSSGIASFRFSDRGFRSLPSDTPANTNWEPRVDLPLQLERVLPLAPENQLRAAAVFGDIVLRNDDGGLDTLPRQYAIDGRRVVVMVGTIDAAYGTFERLFDGTAASYRYADDQTLHITIRDNSWRLQTPIQTTLYTGAGGLEGMDDLKGKQKPLAYGRCLNVSPVSVDTTNLIMQVHDGACQAIAKAYDKGAELTPAGDVADITATSVSAGQFKTQLSGGYIRLGSSPAGLVTCDVDGETAGGTWFQSTADIAKRIVRSRGGFNDSEIDFSAFDALQDQQSSRVGIFIGDLVPVDVADVLDFLFEGVGGWWGCGRTGLLQCGRISAPSETPVATYTVLDILSLERIDMPDTVNPPNFRRTVGYQRNWTVQESDIAASVTDARRVFLGEQYRKATATNLTVQSIHLRASEQETRAVFSETADAEAEAARLMALFGVPRGLFRLTTKLGAYLREVGQTIRVVWPRHGLADGRAAVIVGYDLDCGGNVVILTVMT